MLSVSKTHTGDRPDLPGWLPLHLDNAGSKFYICTTESASAWIYISTSTLLGCVERLHNEVLRMQLVLLNVDRTQWEQLLISNSTPSNLIWILQFEISSGCNPVCAYRTGVYSIRYFWLTCVMSEKLTVPKRNAQLKSTEYGFLESWWKNGVPLWPRDLRI